MCGLFRYDITDGVVRMSALQLTLFTSLSLSHPPLLFLSPLSVFLECTNKELCPIRSPTWQQSKPTAYNQNHRKQTYKTAPIYISRIGIPFSITE